MRTFPTRAAFEAHLTRGHKWHRTLDALDLAPDLAPEIMYSVADTLTYRRTTSAHLSTRDLIGRRRYVEVVSVLSGAATVEVLPKAGLVTTRPYDDLCDREEFEPAAAHEIVVPTGGILVIDIDEAFRILPSHDADVVELHVTVVGNPFVSE